MNDPSPSCVRTFIPSRTLVTQVLVFGTPSTIIIQSVHLPIAQKIPRFSFFFAVRRNERIPAFISAAATGMRILAAPMAGDPAIEAGESGASAFGAAIELLRHENKAFRQLAGLDEHSVILVINTEGATDRANYRRIVWDGAWSR